MAGSSYGNIFRVTTWGESHGKGLGVVVDGVPAVSYTHLDVYKRQVKPGVYCFQILCQLSEIVADCDL